MHTPYPIPKHLRTNDTDVSLRTGIVDVCVRCEDACGWACVCVRVCVCAWVDVGARERVCACCVFVCGRARARARVGGRVWWRACGCVGVGAKRAGELATVSTTSSLI